MGHSSTSRREGKGRAAERVSAAVSLSLLDSAPDAVLGLDAAGRVRLANPAASALFGLPREDLLGLAVEHLVPGPTESATVEHAIRRPTGVEVPVDVSRMALPTADGPMTVLVLRDATERRRVEAELRLSRRRLAEAEQLARIGSWEWDIPGNQVTWSDQLFRIYGLEPQSETPTYEKFLAFVHPDDREDVDARNRKAFADHQPFEDVKRVVRSDGVEILMRTQGEVIVDDSGAPVRMVGVCEDVTAEERAARIRSTLASIVQSSGDAIYSVDDRGRILSWNPAAETLFGFPEDEIVGRSPEILVPSELFEHERTALQRVFAGEGVSRFETQRRHRDGSLVDVAVTISPVAGDIPAAGEASAIAAVSIIARDISERRRLEAQLRHLADYDALTGLMNRRRFEERLAERTADAARHGVGGAVVALDLDNLKEVNDSHGHAAGDALIRTVAHCLRDLLRTTDVVARLDGDEFAILLAHTGRDEAQRVAADLLDAVRHQSVVVDSAILSTTASVGVAVFGADASRGDDVLAAAGQALADAKATGRDRVVVDDPAEGRPSHHGHGHRLREALAHDGLCLHLQPIVALESGEVARYEALVRMHSPEGLVPPSAFVGVAERLGLVHSLDAWVLRHSIALLAHHPGLELEVNLSGHSVGDRSLLTLIESELRAAEVDPARLILEITETAAIANMDEARVFADALQALGCSFALDDFGAGFGSFYYLKHMPADILKIDGDFIAGPRSRVDELVVQSIVRLARELGKRTVAEYVDDEETVRALREWGVDYAQGFHVGRPFPSEEVGARLERSSPTR